MSLAQCYEELGRLRQKIEDKDAKISEIDSEKAALSIANEDIHEELAQYKVLLRKAENEIRKLTQENEYLEKEREHLELTAKQLKEQFGKAQKTIKIQSDAIGVRSRISPEHVTPAAGPVQSFQYVQQVASQPPPPYNPQLSLSVYQHPPNLTVPPPALSRQPSLALHHAPPPMSREASSASFNQSNPSNELRVMIAPPTTHRPFADSQLATDPVQDTLLVSVQARFDPLFDKTERWAHDYTNMPDKERDSSLPSQLIGHIRANTNSDLAPKLLASSNTRYLVVTRVINHTIVKEALKPALIKGFGQFFDKQYADLRLQLHQVGTPLPVRRATLVASAELVVEMTRTKGFCAYLDGRMQSHVHNMWTLLEPLFAEGMDRDKAWRELGAIWDEAAHIGLMVLSKASIFNFDFPPIGVNSHWNQSSMVNREPNFDPHHYHADRAPVSVRLAITPTVTETDFMANMVTPTTLHKAHVLLDF